MAHPLDDAGDFDRSANACHKFTAAYRFDGRTWQIEIWAATREEAEMKLRAMRETAKIDGRVFGEIES